MLGILRRKAASGASSASSLGKSLRAIQPGLLSPKACSSVADEFTAKINTSRAFSFTGSRWAGVASQFSSNSATNDSSGIYCGNVDADIDYKVNPSVVASYRKGLFVGLPTKHIEFHRAFSTIADRPANISDDGKKVLRPLSPHLAVYKPQTSSTSSILHRISGAYLAAVIFGFHVIFLKVGSVCLSYNNFYQLLFYSSTLSQLALAIAPVAISYHVVNGVRHLVADFSGYLFPKIGRKKLKGL
ncbi:unnamed protein product [Cuscuta epithymum]|uniref:Succinate dehydrogenase subunit 3 n=1 Tax=Cuscuta epithymum TaxID=186058 RepID=A0AAV0CG41_9ASTE|nr:unnamed protein product [Cuscuta epithymum]